MDAHAWTVINSHPTLAGSLPSGSMSLTPCPRTGLPPFGIPIIVTHPTLGCPLPSGVWMHVINTYPTLGGSLPLGSPSLTLVPRSVPPPFWMSVILIRPPSVAPYGITGIIIQSTAKTTSILLPPLLTHTQGYLGPTPTLLIRHPCTRNKIVTSWMCKHV